MGARRLVLLIGLMALAGCGGGAAVNRAPADPCETRVPARNPSDTLTVVLFDSVDLSHAPWGRNREERFIFSHLYETLLTIDCHGEFQSGLAKTVLEASDGWLVTLRDDAHFWDDTPVTAYDVVESFKPAIAQGIAIKSVDPIDEHTLLLRGYNERPDVRLLTLQMLSVTKPSPTAGPPIGTGSWMIDESVPFAEAVVIRPVLAEVPMVRFVQGNVTDARDIMDGTADAMITDDPAAIEYARSKKVSLAPLAWDKAYVAISRARTLAISSGEALESVPSDVLNSIARDAVSVDARGGTSIIDASETACAMRSTVSLHSSSDYHPSPNVVFQADDATARELAERIVALVAMDSATATAAGAMARALPGAGPGLRAVPIALANLPNELRSGKAIAYVLSLSWDADFPFVPHNIALAGSTLGTQVWTSPWWLFDSDHRAGLSRLSQSIIPLVETRAHFIAISDRVGYIDDQNGDVRILGPTVVKVR